MPAMDDLDVTAPPPSAPVALEEAIRLLERDGSAFAAARDAREELPLADALGRVLAGDLAARADHPNVDDTSLDGIACRREDTVEASDGAPVRLRLIGESAAGRPFAGEVGPGQAVRIQTGAAVPAGADAIVPVEELSDEGDHVAVRAPGSPDAIRPRGQDVRVGDVGLRAGRRLDAGAVALAAAMGHATVAVRERLRVGVLTGGDEVVPPGGTLGPGDVFDANGPALHALVRLAGAEPVALPHASDAVGALEAAVDGAGALDLLLTCGGISMGRYDRVRDLLETRGRILFRKVWLKPGGPATFAYVGERPWLALPGNPVSASVTFLALARAWLDRAAGATGPLPLAQRLPAVAATTLRAAGPKTTLLRVLLERDGARIAARPAGNQNSGVVRTLADADALAIVPPRAVLEPGDPLEVVPLAPHLS
jgi:molybdopterin molybdotransferase